MPPMKPGAGAGAWATCILPATGCKPYVISAARNWPNPGGNVTLTTDRRQYAQGESVQLRVRFADERLAPAEDDGVTVMVEQPGQQTQRLQLTARRWAGELSKACLTGPCRAVIMPGLPRQRGRTRAGGRFYRFSAARRVRPGSHGRSRHARGRETNRRAVLRFPNGRQLARRSASRPASARGNLAPHTTVE